jgi:hypothetical protein
VSRSRKQFRGAVLEMGVRVPFLPRVAVVTIRPCRISHMRDRDVPPIWDLGSNGTDMGIFR